jgi:hypothetical protein
MAPDHFTLSLTTTEPATDTRPLALTPSPASSAPPSDADPMASLTDLAARGLSLEWFEAVAIVQGLCQAIVESGDNSGPAAPNLNDIYIDSFGGVAATSDGPQTPVAAVQCVGEVLSQILPSNDFMSLRSRIVPRATAAVPSFASVKELSDALAYYERPNRSQIIQSVFERWQSLPPLAPVVAPRRDVVLPKAKSRRLSVTTSLKWLQIGGVVLLAVAAAGALVMWALKTRPWISGPAYTLTYSNDPSLPAEAEDRAQRGAGATKPTKAPEPGRANSRASEPVASRLLYRPEQPVPETSVAEPNRSAALVKPADPAATPETAAPPSPASEIRPPTPVGVAAIYKSDDRDIVPPKVVYPQSLIPSTGARREDVLILEIILNESGRVDSAKALDFPRNLGESLILTNALAATKTWRFHPALKDGQPVRYRELIAVAIH